MQKQALWSPNQQGHTASVYKQANSGPQNHWSPHDKFKNALSWCKFAYPTVSNSKVKSSDGWDGYPRCSHWSQEQFLSSAYSHRLDIYCKLPYRTDCKKGNNCNQSPSSHLAHMSVRWVDGWETGDNVTAITTFKIFFFFFTSLDLQTYSHVSVHLCSHQPLTMHLCLPAQLCRSRCSTNQLYRTNYRTPLSQQKLCCLRARSPNVLAPCSDCTVTWIKALGSKIKG